MRSKFKTFLLAGSLLALLLPALANAQEDDGKATSNSGPVSTVSCPGGTCGGQALGSGSDGVTAPGPVTGDNPVLTVCTGSSCGQLPANGAPDGITQTCPAGQTCSGPSSPPAEDLGITQGGASGGSTSKRFLTKAAVAVPACAGNNYANTHFVDSISMGGPMVAMEWIPSASVTVDGIDVFTGEVVAPDRLAIWSDNGGTPARPLSPLAWTANFQTTLPDGWQGASLNTRVSVAAGVRYWVVWDPSGGEQASVSQDVGDIQQKYWGSYSGTVQGGAAWFGPFTAPDHRWKFRMHCSNGPCDGNNYGDNTYLDSVSMGGPMVGIAWIPVTTGIVTRIELYTGELAASSSVALWADNGGGPSQPLSALSWSNPFNTTLGKGWQGADLLTPVSVTAGTLYWVVWDPAGGEQAPVTNNPGDIQQTYWGSSTGNVTGGATWNGPYSFTDRRWKFRVFCQDKPCDGNNYANNHYFDPALMGGPMVGISWTPSLSNTITGIEVFTGEVVGVDALALWSDNGGSPGQPLAPLSFTNNFNTVLLKGWQGATLTSPVTVTAGHKYWVVWDPAGGEQASVSNDAGDIQQTYWGSPTGNVTGGATWNGPYSFPDRRWKFRMICGNKPCEGNNYANNDYLDPVLMGGPLVGIRWVPTASVTVARVEVFTGEVAQPDSLAIWSSDGGSPSKPLAPLGVTGPFTTSLTDGWQGGNLTSSVSVTAGTEYWVVWDPTGGEQASVTADAGDVQQAYWGSYSGTVSGGASWFGPFSFTDRRWKFRMFCTTKLGQCGPGTCVGGSYCDSCVCYTPEAAISRLACQCRLLDPSCGIGECISGSYCDGPYCPLGVCHAPSTNISLAMCSGLILGPTCR
jgi:hypothetical protein